MSGSYRGRDASRALIAALILAADHAGLAIMIASAEVTPWESATFAGARHRMIADIAGETADIATWLQGLPEHPFALVHHIVADIVVVAHNGTNVVIEALTVTMS